MALTNLETVSGWQQEKSEQAVSLEIFAQMTGFPVKYVKSELMVKEDEITLDELRSSMLSYLDKEVAQSNLK